MKIIIITIWLVISTCALIFVILNFRKNISKLNEDTKKAQERLNYLLKIRDDGRNKN